MSWAITIILASKAVSEAKDGALMRGNIMIKAFFWIAICLGSPFVFGDGAMAALEPGEALPKSFESDPPLEPGEALPKNLEIAPALEPEEEKEILALPKSSESFSEKGDRDPASSARIKKTGIIRDKSFKVPGAKTPQKRKKRLSLKDVKPPSSARLYYAGGSDEAELEAVINEEIAQLFRLLKRDRSAELTLRLGSLYVEKARLISFKLQMDYEKKMEGFKAGRRKSKPYLNLSSARIYNKKSLKLFEDFRISYPKHRRMDEVLFFLGFNFYQLDNEKRGIKYFTELESRFPKSLYLYESRFQLGEHYFKLGQWNSSFKYYSKVARNKRGKFYFFALYKMAWSAYKMGRASQGLALLERIISEGREFKVVSDRDQIFTFTNEAKEDLILFYTYSKKSPLKAKSFFVGLLGDEQAWPALKRLAYAYRDTGQTKGVFALFEALIQHDPSGEEAFEYKYQIVEAMYNFGKIPDIISQLNEWVKNYGPKGPWARANRRNKALIEKSFSFQEVTIRNYALKNHETFRRTKAGRAKTLALSFYKAYFDHFQESKFLDQMRFFYAELLFDSRKYISAVKSYEEVISLFPGSKYAKPAYINQLLAMEKALPGEREITALVGKREEPMEFPGAVKSFVKVAGRYIEKFPAEKNSPSILYRMAALHYKFNQFAPSAKLFEKLSSQYPQSKLAGNVGGILLDIYNKNKDYKSLEELALRLSKNKNVDKELLREVKSILEQISFKKAQDLALGKKYAESAKLYERFARASPGSPLAPSAFYNAGLNFEKAGDRLSAISMYSSVLTYKGRSSRAIRKKSQGFLPVLHEKLGFYKKSAGAYVSFAKSYPSDSKTADFWYNAGVIFDGLNDRASALYSYQQHFNLSKKAERHEIFYLIGLMFEKSRQWQKAVENYSKYLKSPSSNRLRLVRASFSVADIFDRRLRNAAKAGLWHKKTIALSKRLGAGVSYAARSRFYTVQSAYTNFSKVRIPAGKQQTALVAKKLQLLKNLEQALKPVIRYDDGEQIIASLSLIGQANKEMAQAIYQAPLPKGLDKKGRAQYREGIKKLISPYIKKSVEHYRLALKKSASLELYSEWAGKAFRGLAGIQTANGEFQKFLPEPLAQEILTLRALDPTGTVTEGFLQTLTKSLKYGLSRSDFEALARAIASKKEGRVLTAVSSILNKDPDNIVAINSLAIYYLKSGRWGMGALILSRIPPEKSNASVIMNNLAMISLRYGNVREAVVYLKKALSGAGAYTLAQANLAGIFIKSYDYRNAYKYYKMSYKDLLKKWPAKDRKTLALLNNYGAALTGARRWSEGEALFQNLSRRPSPLPEFLFNYAVFLSEKSKGEGRDSALSSLSRAKELADELSLYKTAGRLKRKTRALSNSVSARLKELKTASLETQQRRKK